MERTKISELITTNVAVWGLGNHAVNRIIPALNAIDEIRLIGVCSRDRKVVEVSEKQWGCYGWSSPEEMLNNKDVHVIYISTPIGVHFSLAEKALLAGKHVWCEKPLTCDYEDTKNLVSLAKKVKKGLTESFMYLHHSQFLRVKKFIDDSNSVKSVICRFGIPALENPGFRNDPKLCGGAFWDVGSYPISAIHSLFPGKEIKILFSEVKKKTSVDTEGRVLLHISNVTTTYLEWGIGVAYRNEIDVWTKEGSIFTDMFFSKPKDYLPIYYMRDLNGKVFKEQGEQCDQFAYMFKKFVKLIGDDQKISAEMEIILDRAKLMNDVYNFNRVENEKLEKY